MSKGSNVLTVIAVLALGYWALSDTASQPPSRTTRPPSVARSSDDRTADEDRDDDDTSEEDVAKVRGGETYAAFDRRRDALDTGRFSGGDECTDDCGGHDAGRAWAEDKGINDPDDCGGKSWSFEEGCRSYAEDQQASERDEGDEEAPSEY